LEVENNMYSKMLALDDKYSSINKNYEKMKRQIEETYNPFMELDNMKAQLNTHKQSQKTTTDKVASLSKDVKALKDQNSD